jgi:hypothetical protein
MPDALKSVASARSGAEAELICSRLLDEGGIHAIAQRNIGGPEWGGSGGQTVFVDEQDFERAQEILGTQPVSDEELARLSEEAGREAAERGDLP